MQSQMPLYEKEQLFWSKSLLKKTDIVSLLQNLLKFTLIGSIWFSHLLTHPVCHDVSPLVPIYYENLVPLWCVPDKERSILIIFSDIYGYFWDLTEAPQMVAFSRAVAMWNMKHVKGWWQHVEHETVWRNVSNYASSPMRTSVISGKSQLETFP